MWQEMHRGSDQHWSPGCMWGGQVYIIDVLPRSPDWHSGLWPLAAREGWEPEPPEAGTVPCWLGHLPVPMHSPALSPAAVSASEAPGDLQAVLHCGKYLLQLVPSSIIYMTTVTENSPVQVEVIFCISVPNNLETCFGMLWELLETVKAAGCNVSSLTSLFLVYPRIRQICSHLAEQQEKTEPVLPTGARMWRYRWTENGETNGEEGGVPWCSQKSHDYWSFVECQTGRVSSSLPSLQFCLIIPPLNWSKPTLNWNGAPLSGMNSVTPVYQSLHLEGLLSLWVVL